MLAILRQNKLRKKLKLFASLGSPLLILLRNFRVVCSEYSYLLSNCTKQSTNNSCLEYKYPAISRYGNLDSWLFFYRKEACETSWLRASLLYPLCFSRLTRNEQKDSAESKKSSWIINNLLDVLACSIAECFYQTVITKTITFSSA